MAKQKIVITGDWDEGLDIVQKAFEGSSFESLPVDQAEIRNALKKKVADFFIFCTKGYSPELIGRISELRRINDAVPIFIFSKVGDVNFVVNAIKNGVNDFFVKPLETKRFLERIEREIYLYQLTNKVFMTNFTVEEYSFEGMIGHSKPMQENYKMITAVAKSNATVLITGESGVGKELVAQAVHKKSDRSQHRFVDINCGAIPRELLENELFGHEKGAFTGAHKRYIGSFETAHKGTVFLDEISEMDPLLQVKLLRALQERTITRIGSNETIKVDVRIITATNKNLVTLIEDGRFREDLFYRLNVVNIHIPPLRERRDDIPLLAKHFLEYFSAKNDKIFMDFSNEAMEALINYEWPGNVRELENTVERLVVLHDDSQVKIRHLPNQFEKVNRSIGYTGEAPIAQEDAHVLPLEELERRAIEAALLKFQGSVAVAAKKLKIGQATLYRKVKKFGLQVS